jgi:pyridoxine 4-dehydrogenase
MISAPMDVDQPAKHWSRLGLGTGNLASLGSSASLREVVALLGVMAEIGATVIDTADSYGSGECERMLGKALQASGTAFLVVTKAGYRHGDLPGPLRPLNQFVKKGLHLAGKRQCFEPSYLKRCAERSLSRLNIGQLGAFLLHSPPVEALTDERVLATCRNLVTSGKAACVGLSSENPLVLDAAIKAGVFGVVETPASLKSAAVLQEIWRRCQHEGIHVVGNHVFVPTCLTTGSLSHEMLMRSTAALFPSSGTLLSGTRNESHLRQNWEWVNSPLTTAEAIAAAGKCVGDTAIRSTLFHTDPT